jgi:tRNA pseudouridine55 synthase
MELHGFLNIDKPLGWTSHDVVGRLRRIVGTRKVGHAGTLDPAATGVLVAGVGRATRFLDYVQYGSKSYVAHVVLGVASETADIDGRVESSINVEHSSISREEIERLLPSFQGSIEQVPPKYSAVKQSGEPLYRKIRRGEPVDVPVRTVRVDSLSVLSWSWPDLILEIECGSGVYVRSLAQDIGDQLGTGGYLHHLIRTRVGAFSLSSALSLDTLANAGFPECWALYAASIDAGLQTEAALLLGNQEIDAWYHGRSIRASGKKSINSDVPVRALNSEGDFAGLAMVVNEGNSRAYRPKIVIPKQ